MIQIDGKTVDLTNPQTWGDSIKEQQSLITQLTARITALETP